MAAILFLVRPTPTKQGNTKMTTQQVVEMAKNAGIEAAADRRYVALTNGDRQVIVDTKYDNQAKVEARISQVK